MLPNRPEASEGPPLLRQDLKDSGPRAGTFNEGTRTFIPDTVYLLLDT